LKADILIPQDKIQDFFFLNDEEEQEQYGHSTQKAAVALSTGLLSEKPKDQAGKFKQIQDFKIKVLDFVSIYIKEMDKQEGKNSIDVIKGLLKGLQVAHSDRNAILFERIKAVISMMAKGHRRNHEEEEEDSGLKANKILMTELVSLLLKQSRDAQLQKAYADCFLFLTRYFYQSGSKKLAKFLVFTYKELLKTFLSGRTNSAAVNAKFFQQAFEQNPPFGWSFTKLLLKCILSLKKPTAESKGSGDDLRKNSAKDDDEGEGARSNHQ